MIYTLLYKSYCISTSAVTQSEAMIMKTTAQVILIATVYIPTFYFSDINECAQNNGACDRFCNNTEGSFFCQCGDGYNLNEDGRQCDGKVSQ